MTRQATDISLTLLLEHYPWLSEEEALELFDLYHGDRAAARDISARPAVSDQLQAVQRLAPKLGAALRRLSARERIAAGWPGIGFEDIAETLEAIGWQAMESTADHGQRDMPERRLVRRLLVLYETREVRSAESGERVTVGDFVRFVQAYAVAHGVLITPALITSVIKSRRPVA